MFINLRNHTHYSLLKALPKINQLVKKAKAEGVTHIGICDFTNMYGAIEFYKTCEKEGVSPIIGVEFFIVYSDRKFRIELFAKNLAGYKNLMRLTSIANINHPEDPKLTDEDLEKYSSGIIALSGGIWGDLNNLISINKDEAKRRLSFYKKTFGDDYYIEINPQKDLDGAELLLKNSISFAEEENVPLIVTSNSHYLAKEEKSVHKTLYLVHGDEYSQDEYANFFQKESFHLYTEKELEAINFIPKSAIENTTKVANMCSLKIPLGDWVFPNIEFKKSYDEDLRELTYAGLKDRNKELTEEVRERIDYELKVIKDKGYSPYFLVVYDLLRFARENGILTNIRGSVAGSITTYLLRITKCDPMVYKLPFERFLNPERPSAPDIDMDFSDSRRDEVLDYARRKYGIENVAQIGTFGTMMARGAIKDVARAMKFPYTLGDRISKLVPMPKQGFPVTIASALEDVPELKEMYDTDREVQMVIDMAQKIEGCARHISVHAAGTVISPAPLWEWTPIQKDPKGGKVITQYDMYTIEDAGLLKFDFLGIRNLTILGDAISIVKERYKENVDIENIPLDDKKTFDLLSRGDTIGLFQLNGSGMTRFLKELKPTTIFDINAMVALYRPGPLEMIPEYIKRKHNPSLVEYLDKRLEPILDQSFGVIVYQDDVMLTAIHLAGYSWLEADKLRKAMGKKIPAEMEEQKGKLMKGFIENGLSQKKADELWRLIEPFAAYGFNKAHAASYGRVAYQTAYMKANFPVAYMTSVLTNESGDIEKVAEIVSECKRMNIEVLPPDVNESEGGFSIIRNDNGVLSSQFSVLSEIQNSEPSENRKLKTENYSESIRFGLYTIKNLGKDISDAIIKERKDNGPYRSFENFIERVNHNGLNKRSLEALTMCGAFDKWVERGEVLFNMEEILSFHKHKSKSSMMQESLFGNLEETKFVMKKAPPVSKDDKLKWEKELLGLFVSGFPLDDWKEKILARNIDIEKVKTEIKDNQEVTLACIIESIKTTKTKKGDIMALLKIRDYSGVIEVAVFPETYKNYKSVIIIDIPIIVKGKVSTRNGDKTLSVNEIKKLEK